MEHLYSLNRRSDKKETIDSLIFQKDSKLYHASIETYIEDNQKKRFISQSFEYCKIKNNDSPLSALFKYGDIYSTSSLKAKDFRLNKFAQIPGEFNPRVFRPFIQVHESINFGVENKIDKLAKEVFRYPDFTPNDFTKQIMAVNQLGTLKEILLTILDTTYPATSNLKTYGQNIKNLLVLSCIEVETQLKGIFKANEFNAKTSNYTTKDFVKLKDILHLDKYSVKYPYYPALKPITPFKKWKASNPTTSLKWYDSYNSIKHNGELDFNKATLENAISAFSAVAILLKAQYGNHIPFWEEKVGGIIEVTNNITWSVNEMLLPPLKKGHWIPTKIGF